MGYNCPQFFRVDLGVIHVPQPCGAHTDTGYDTDCDACTSTPEKELPVPHLAGYWVELRNPDLLPYGKKKELYAPAGAVSDQPTAQERLVQAQQLQERRERIIAGLTTAWNIEPVDPEDPGYGKVLPVPSVDRSALDRAPDIVNQTWAGLARAQRNAESAVPKANATV